MLAPTRTSHSNPLCLTSLFQPLSMWQSGPSHWHPTWVIGPQVLILLTQNRVLSLLSNCLCPSIRVSSPTTFLCIPSRLGPLLSFPQTRQDHTSTSSQCSPSYTISSSKRVQTLLKPWSTLSSFPYPLPTFSIVHISGSIPFPVSLYPLECKFCEDMGVFLPFLYYHSAWQYSQCRQLNNYWNITKYSKSSLHLCCNFGLTSSTTWLPGFSMPWSLVAGGSTHAVCGSSRACGIWG